MRYPPAKTAAMLVTNPFQAAYAEAAYRTGDLVTLDEAGDFIFLGRTDGMVKTRGYRVEFGEVEAALYACPAVREAVVLVDRAGLRGTPGWRAPADSLEVGLRGMDQQIASRLGADRFLVHAPSVFDFRERDDMLFAYLSDSDSVNVTSIYEMYPIGWFSLKQHLADHGLDVAYSSDQIMPVRRPFGGRWFDDHTIPQEMINDLVATRAGAAR